VRSKIVQPKEGWEVTASETHFSDAHLTVVTEQIRTPARPTVRSWNVVRRKPAVVVAPMTRDGHVILIRQERIPIRRAIWEMPAGQIDEGDEPDDGIIRKVALRELTEETGYRLAPDGELISLGEFFSSPGFTDERAYLFLARPVEPSPAGHSHEESEAIIECRAFDVATLAGMIVRDEICDANTLSTYARLVAADLIDRPPR
jgi:ADP-ribose pyrophosphatase